MLKRYTILGTLFVLILGTLAHYFYEWSNNNFFVGLFTPVNESTWEHMKLVFFPMLIFSFTISHKLQHNYPYIETSMLTGTIIGTALIPIIFYTYTGILGCNIFFLDIATFIIAVIIAFYIIYYLTSSGYTQNYTYWIYLLTCILFVCFILFTLNPPKIDLFISPTVTIQYPS